MNDNAINAMLKMLEEPPQGTFFLLSGIELQVLPTIRSRVMIIRLGELPNASISSELALLGADGIRAARIANESAGSMDIALKLMREPQFEKLRKTALNAFFTVLSGGKLFDASDALGIDADSARASIYFMLSACHDILLKKSGCFSMKPFNEDFGAEASAAANSLKYCELLRIASLISASAQRISPIIKLSRVFDMLMIDIAYPNNTAVCE